MTVMALVSAKGAPGVTTSALLLAALWPATACLLEADPAGGDLRYWQTDADRQPLRPDLGVLSLLAAHRTGTGGADGADRSVLAHTQLLPGGLPVLVGAGSPAQHAALAPSWSLVLPTLQPDRGTASDGSGVVIVDSGRLLPDPQQRQLLATAALVLLVCRPTVSSVAHTRDALDSLRGSAADVGVLVIGSPTERDQTRHALDVDERCLVAALPDDPVAARGLAGEWTRKLDRSPLVAAGRRLAVDLHRRFTIPPSPPPPASPLELHDHGVSPTVAALMAEVNR